ncbi:MAG TPA: EamA family transporter [Candidatus Limnocylindrales bacterium]
MIAILGGFGAAVAWATSTLCSSRSTRILGPATALAWVMIVGLLITLPPSLAGPWPEFTPSVVTAMGVSGVTNVLGLLLAYGALRLGKVAVIAPILSTEGAIAAAIAIGAGEQVAPAALAILAAISVGIVFASRGPGEEATSDADSRAVLLAISGAAMFGINLYLTGWLGSAVPVAWAVLPARVFGSLMIALPLAVVGRLWLTRRAATLVVVVAIAEVAGTVSLALGARDGIAIASVLAAQFGGIAAIVAFVLFRERLARTQVAGVITIALGVGLLSAIRA